MDDGKTLWERVCATVTRFGQPRPPRQPIIPLPEPERVIDLHGMTVHRAFAYSKHFLADTPYREILVITGQGRISYEFRDWCQQWPRITAITPQRGNGAYLVKLRPR